MINIAGEGKKMGKQPHPTEERQETEQENENEKIGYHHNPNIKFNMDNLAALTNSSNISGKGSGRASLKNRSIQIKKNEYPNND